MPVDSSSVADAAAVAEEDRQNPYPGLRPYKSSETHLFFGREKETKELLNRLSYFRFLAVVGTSGCGKSSLVRAGLIPALEAGYDCDDIDGWRIAEMRPGREPIAALAKALFRICDSDGDYSLKGVTQELGNGSLGIARIAENAGWKEGTKLFLLVDQFEELFTMGPDGDEAADFVQLLLDAAWTENCQIHVVITLRSDENLGKCTRFSRLPTAINNGLFLVPRMDREQIRDAIQEPVDGRLGHTLQVRLLSDLHDNAGAGDHNSRENDELPILQHALMRIWKVWASGGCRGELDICHYEQIGELRNALSQHIEEGVMNSIKSNERELARALFLDIVGIGEAGQMNRRPRPFKELVVRLNTDRRQLQRVVDAFRQDGRSFLLPSIAERPSLGDRDMIDISHESLIRQWKWLREAAQRRFRDLEDIAMIRRNARFWDAHGRRESDLNLPVEQLEFFNLLANTYPSEVGGYIGEFLELNLAAANTAARRRKMWATAGVLVLVVFIASVAFAVTEKAKAEAERVRVQANIAKSEAELATAQAEAAKALSEKKIAESVLAQAKADAASALAASEKLAAEKEVIALEKEKAEERAAAAEEAYQLVVEREGEKQNLYEAKQRELLEQLRALEGQSASPPGKDLRAVRQQQVETAYSSLLSSRITGNYENLEAQLATEVEWPRQGEMPRENLLTLLRRHAEFWPRQDWAILAGPEFASKDDLQVATVSAVLSFEFENISEEPMYGAVEETTHWNLEGDSPVLISLTSKRLSAQELLQPLQAERQRLSKQFVELDNVDPTALRQLKEDMVINLFWLFEISANSKAESGDNSRYFTDSVKYFEQKGTISRARVSELMEDFSDEWRERFFTPLGMPEANELTPGKFEVVGEALVQLEGGSKKQSDFRKIASTSIGVVVDSSGSALIESIQSEYNEEVAFEIDLWVDPWRFEQLSDPELTEDDKNWNRMKSLATSPDRSPKEDEELVKLFAELYILAGNPGAHVPQPKFFAESGKVKNYYGSRSVSLDFIEKDLRDYQRRYPSRMFDRLKVGQPKKQGNDQYSVEVAFDVRHRQTSARSSRSVDLEIELFDDRWPVIIEVE